VTLPIKATDQPVIDTSYGPVIGQRSKSGIIVFKGIRYGADTTGRRFLRPLNPMPWTSPKPAHDYGPDCPQRGSTKMSEDCLFLNIWAPTTQKDHHPVVFYIHGGAYSHGSGSDPLYDGTKLANKGDVIVITVNHRLGLLGYGYFNQLAAPTSWQFSGNAGQLDLIMALQWVQKNVKRFGGDPNNITVIGQSGGGGKIATLMAMPAAKGLFHKAITMSGQQVTASGPLNATKRSEALLSNIGVAVANIQKLAKLPVSDLLAASGVTDPVLGYSNLYFGPVLDMHSLLRHPFYPDAAQQSADIPMIIGNTLDETRLFLTKNPMHHNLTWETLPKFLGSNMRVDIDPYYVRDTYRKLFPTLNPSEIFFKATTAARSWRAAIIEAEERAKLGAATWVYQLNWQSPKDNGKWRAPHTLDIPLIFMNTDVAGAISGNTKGAQQMAGIMSDMVIAFAKTGKPQAATMPTWPVFNLKDRATMIMDLTTRVKNDPRGSERKLFETVPYIQPGS
jgi:para-nitrobenzyl esterase